ncbi:MAG: TIGR02444 family protein [Alphaproteobacteria bacterium]|nr:TIGR02444 family protein [Alphaproteobacteria bacterium]
MENINAKGENPFWDFSLDLYRAKDVEAHSLSLQDEYGLDVNLVFLLIWAGFQGAKLTDDSVTILVQHAKAWSETSILPLRQLRQKLKCDIGAVATGQSAQFRQKIKDLELEAERIQQDMLYELIMGVSAVNAKDGERKSVARRNLLTYIRQNDIDIDEQIKTLLESILGQSETVILKKTAANSTSAK